MGEEGHHDPASILSSSALSEDIAHQALIILNSPIASRNLLSRLWQSSSFHICADGGANRLHDLLAPAPDQRTQHLPSLIHGDLDSLTSAVRDFYTAHGVSITHDGDQYSTDFGKAMKQVRGAQGSSGYRCTAVLGSLGGRVDQAVGLLGEFAREARREPTLELWLVTEQSVSLVLRGPASHTVRLSGPGEEHGLFTPNVGILPVYGPACISTRGLEWDVSAWKTRMGGQVSTSNHVVAADGLVSIETDVDVLFTAELRDHVFA